MKNYNNLGILIVLVLLTNFHVNISDTYGQDSENACVIAYSGTLAMGDHVFLLNDDGSVEPIQARGMRQIWSSDGRWLLSVASSEISITDVENKETIFPNIHVFLYGIRWFPDDKHLVARVDLENNDHYQLGIIEAETGNLEVIAPDLPGNFDLATVSPDGQWLAFSYTSTGRHIFLYNIVDKILTLTVANAENPIWSPDGTTIVFKSLKDGFPKLLLNTATDHAVIQDIPIRIPDILKFEWSPDGQYFAFNTLDHNIYVYHVESEQLYDLGKNLTSAGFPTWSPNSQYVVFSGEQDEQTDLYLYDVSTHTARNITQRPAKDDGILVWSPDGQYIAFRSNAEYGGYGSEVWLYDMTTDSVNLFLADVSGQMAWSPNCKDN